MPSSDRTPLPLCSGPPQSHNVMKTFQVFFVFLLCLTSLAGAAGAGAPPVPWQSADVGAKTLPGAASFDNGAFTVSGAGGDIQDVADGFRFVYQPMRGDMVLTARVASLTPTAPWAKAGVMLREGLDAGAKNALLAVTPEHGVAFQHRDAVGAATATEETPGVTAPVWLQIRRVGGTVTAFRSSDGNDWTSAGSLVSVPLGTTVFAGLAVTSHEEATLGKAVFDQVSLAVEKPKPADPRDLTVTVSAVEPGIFHLIAYRKGNAPPPASPFVVETGELTGQATHVRRHPDPSLPQRIGSGPGRAWPEASSAPPLMAAGTIHLWTTAATLEVSRDNGLRLRDVVGRDLLPSGTIGSADDSIVLTLTHDPHERFYGAGNESENHAGPLTHPSGTQIVSNGVTRIPFLWSTGGWSVLVANNQLRTSWNDDNGTLTWTVPGPYLDLYLSVAPDGYGLLDAYSRLTGRAPIPPRWTFGFMLSRWGYADAADVQDKWQGLRDRQIPVDSFEYDYDWFYNDWDFNPKTFPPGSLAKMKGMGLHFVGIRKPRVTGGNLDYARSQGWVLSSPLGTDLRFDLPVARYWWWSHHVPLVQAGVDGWWNDEAEQSADEFFQMTQAEWEGGRVASPRRVWSISRAFAPGMQRFGAAVWTGDIDSSWATLANQPGTMLNWSLAGMPYVGQDIGGFQSTPTPELYARWIEEGVFVPVMRAHGTFNSPRWPWAFGDDVLAVTKKAIELRYRLIPYWYTVAAENAQTGAPLMRPLFLEFPQDEKTFNLGDEWLVGSGLLAAPVLTQGGTRDVYLPAGQWYDFNTSAPVTGGQTLHVQAPLDLIPAYVRAGTILPLGPVIQSTSLGPEDPLEVRVYPGADGEFTLYEDDGDTYAYQQGTASRILMRWDDRTKTLTVGLRTGSFPGMLTTRHLVVVLPGGARKTVTYVGSPVQIGF